jgi:hypothetical protein
VVAICYITSGRKTGLEGRTLLILTKYFRGSSPGQLCKVSFVMTMCLVMCFIDDLCGSGTQAAAYTEDLVRPIKQLNANARISYYTLFATSFGLGEVKKLGSFDDVATMVELDESFRCFSANSRIYSNEKSPFNKVKAEEISRRYGARLLPAHPLGWRDGQLLVGFCHNTPDNTLPIVWYDEPEGEPWTPLFRRYPKQYGWET